jgi:hypothetical protein
MKPANRTAPARRPFLFATAVATVCSALVAAQTFG